MTLPDEHPGPPSRFEAAYAGTPPWDIGRPQPAFLALVEAGLVTGRVLDVGCGTGEHTLLAAGMGLEAVGIDSAPTAIDRARRKAVERGLPARFVLGDALAARLHLLCFSDQAPGSTGPRRIRAAEIVTAFAEDWNVEEVRRDTIDVTTGAQVPALLATLSRR